jgi:tRNA uridine 5-carboxymethylaminomethyl modification enzyme
MKVYDIIITGAGHAGCEAALACARMGCNSLLVTMRKDNIAQMSCNPSIGGVGKGQLVKEIDALGGEMAKAADATGIHFRMLNKSRGPAVWSSRAQIDRHKYSDYMRSVILSQPKLEVLEDEALEVVTKENRLLGIRTKSSGVIKAKAVIITPGTFLNGLVHIGLQNSPAGRYEEPASISLSESLKNLGFEIATLKTGTTPRIKKDSIDFGKLKPQPGDEEPTAFSFSTHKKLKNRVVCHITYTNSRTHAIIRKNLDRSPLYTGIIRSTGVRYCPSIEDKIVKFADRDRHQVFLEPEGTDTSWYYPNGLATSLPLDVQEEMLHSIEGLEDASIIRPGYGIEYEFLQPTQLFATLESKSFDGLYFAGQVNGTTGYEEAAAQGLMAGINAALKVKNRPGVVLGRSDGYIGVLIDDLVTKGTAEPYRMFTSRVEYRLMLREDNADIRLMKYGYNCGLVAKKDFENVISKEKSIRDTISMFDNTRIKPSTLLNKSLEALGTRGLEKPATVSELLRRPQVRYKDLKALGILGDDIPEAYTATIELLIKYDGFIKRQLADVGKMKELEKISIPSGVDFSNISGLSREIVEKLKKIKPVSLAQASRISGVTPSAIMILMVYFKKYKKMLS